MPTAIQWTEETWNPVTGCTRVSPGCAHCYIERTPPFRMEGRRFARVGSEETTGVRLHPDRLDKPLHWRKPRRIFVCSLADLFHEEIDYHFVREVFNVMRRCNGEVVAATGKPNPAHTFQVLTKRPERALELWRDRKLGFETWPPNIWLGVSIENARYTWRADVLREIPAAARFISAEPLLGSLYPGSPSGEALDDYNHSWKRQELDLTGIDWVIIGGESGPKARPFRLEHAREIIHACLDQCPLCGQGDIGEGCVAEGRRPAVFVKQLGAKPVEVQGDELFTHSFWLKLHDRKGGDPDEWPADLRIREFPRTAT